MADIVELTNQRLPFELVNIVFSFLGASPSSEIIKGAIEDIKEYDEEKMLYNDRIIILNKDNKYPSYGKYKIYNNAFFKFWKECIDLNTRLNQIREKPKMILDITQNYLEVDGLECKSCWCKIIIDDYKNYDRRCEWCYAEHLGHEVFRCQDCSFRSDELSDFINRDDGFWCQNCEPPESEEEYETDDEENEVIIEQIFWEE